MVKESIQAIKEALLTVTDATDERLASWREDERSGVQQAIKQWERRQLAKEQEWQLFKKMSQFEEAAYKKGHRLIAGIDEVGRGPLAGPVVTAAVILPKDCQLLGLNDSKKLSAKKRETLYNQIQEQAGAIGLGIADQGVIDQINIYQATKQAMKMAIDDLAFAPDYLLIDAMQLDVPQPQESLIKGDARSISIAAASIIAKVTRDRLMEEYDELYPGYGFKNNAGYGTKEHLLGLEKYGVTPIHRRTFAPIKDMI
ncbi:ribonuclease HII [Enterococcus faecalis]|uniref:ribonuclease HII n=1 Tax=Enterococcus faecalis TaxID=1351 RepID=UPI001E642D46|nr:ribonuclease HII [Enterococcus faecalis]MCD5258404.1 ribonuclease HII [Enterococcus faecalis]